MSWDYKREESNGFKPIPEGRHRVRIESVERAVSKSGNDMLTIKLAVSNYSAHLFHYITFMPSNPQMTNRMLTQLYDSFKDIPEGNTDIASWVGKVGACMVKHEEYNGNMSAKISYFISADKQGDLPPWVEKADEFVATSAADTPDVPFI